MITLKVECLPGDDLRKVFSEEMPRLANVTGCRIAMRGNGVTFSVWPGDTTEELGKAFDEQFTWALKDQKALVSVR